MTIQELETLAARGFKRDDESENPGRDEIMTVIEIKTKAAELYEEVNSIDRWDKTSIARKSSALVWFCARIAGMYGINLDEAIKQRSDELKKESPAPSEKPKPSPTGTKNEKNIYRPKRKPTNIPKIGKYQRPRGA